MFTFGLGRKLLFAAGVSGQTSLNNPDFSEFPANEENADGTYGWIEIADPFDSVGVRFDNCGFPQLSCESTAGGTGDIVYENTAYLSGGLIYDVDVQAHGFGGVNFTFDAFIGDIGQGVGGSDSINDNTLQCEEHFPYGGQIDASGISGTFKFRITIQAVLFDQFRIKSINLNPI